LISTGASQLRIVLLGPPASGKGTQGRRIAQALGLGYLSTGALLREQVENHTPLGQLAKPILDRGEYLPDDLMCRILADWLNVQSAGWVLDGFPRSLPQAEYLDVFLNGLGLSIDRAISLEVPLADLLQRIRQRVECPTCRWSGQKSQALQRDACPLCGTRIASRPDDNQANFTNRHQEFVRLTLPVVTYYRQTHRLLAIDATAPEDHVAEALLGQITSIHGANSKS